MSLKVPFERHLRDAGLWAEQRGSVSSGPALFVDRDGVLVEEMHFLRRPDDVCLTIGAGEAIRAFNERAIPVIMVTNQSGIARGILDWAAFASVQDEIHRQLAASGAHVDAVYACAYLADGAAPLNVADHAWRKPNPEMILAAAAEHGLDLSGSWIVGDRASDLIAGQRAGMPGGTLVATGYGSDERQISAAEGIATPGFKVRRAANLADALATLSLG